MIDPSIPQSRLLNPLCDLNNQELLYGYLMPWQQHRLDTLLLALPQLRAEQLCTALLDYVESGLAVAPADADLARLFRRLIGAEEDGSPAVVKTLRTHPQETL